MKKRTRHNIAFTCALLVLAGSAYVLFMLFGTWSSELNERHVTTPTGGSTKAPQTNTADTADEPTTAVTTGTVPPVATATFVNADPEQGSTLAGAPPAITIRFAKPLGPSSSIRIFDTLDRPVHLGVVAFSEDRQVMTIGVLGSATGTLQVRYSACAVDNSICDDGTYDFSIGL